MGVVRERPILFSGPMVRAILAGRKTVTRRVVLPAPPECPDTVHPANKPTRAAPYIDSYRNAEATPENPGKVSDLWCWWTRDNRMGPIVGRCPYGKPGDRLWVRETFRADGAFAEFRTGRVWYRAEENASHFGPWRPSIFMPRWASRLTLEVVSIRVERLHDISDDEIDREGVVQESAPGFYVSSFDGKAHPTRIALWAQGWQGINGKRPGCAWDDNPWVWRVEFRPVDPAS